MRDQRDDTSRAQFRTFFDRPFHAIELKNGERERKTKRGAGGNFFSEFKFDTLVRNRRDAGAAYDTFSRNIEFLPNAGTENAGQMVGVLADEKASVAGYFIGDPATAGHKLLFGPIACCRGSRGCPDEESGTAWCFVALRRAENIFNFAQQAAGLRFVVDARGAIQLQQQFPLTLRQLAWGLHSHFDEQVPLASAIEHRHSFAANAERAARLRAFRNFELVIAFQRGHHDFSPKRRLCERNRDHAMQIVALALKE